MWAALLTHIKRIGNVSTLCKESDTFFQSFPIGKSKLLVVIVKIKSALSTLSDNFFARLVGSMFLLFFFALVNVSLFYLGVLA